MNTPSPVAIAALHRKKVLEAVQSNEDSASTDPKPRKTSSKPTSSSTPSSGVTSGHRLASADFSYVPGEESPIVVKCECGYLPTDPDDYRRHLDTVKTKSIRKPFARPDHLTERPFLDNSDLKKLREELIKNNHPAGRGLKKKENKR